MTSEKLAKAILHKQYGAVKKVHKALSKLPKILMNKRYAKKLGFNSEKALIVFLKTAEPVMKGIEDLCPAMAGENMPNVEYPWPLPDGTWVAPCLHYFAIFDEIKRRNIARQLVWLFKQLIERFDEIF